MNQIPAHPNNYSKGRTHVIDQITFHHIVGDAGAAIARFKDGSQQVSANYVISSNGVVTQMVKESDTPYTDGNYTSNSRSITIEHAGGIPSVPYTEAMYKASIALVKDIRSRHKITRFKRHRDIVATACPGGLNVERIVKESNPKGAPVDNTKPAGHVRANQIFKAVLHRGMTKAEYTKHHSKKTELQLFEAARNSTEYKNLVKKNADTTAKLASTEKAKYAAEKLNEELHREIDRLKAETGDSSEANLIGKALIQLITKFGYKRS